MFYLLSRSMIKPDGVQRNVVGNIIGRFEAKGYQLKVAHSNTAHKPVDLQKSAKSDYCCLVASFACDTSMQIHTASIFWIRRNNALTGLI